LILKKHMNYQFEKLDKKEITISALAKSLNCSISWLSTLYKRYKNKEPLEKERGHRKEKYLIKRQRKN